MLNCLKVANKTFKKSQKNFEKQLFQKAPDFYKALADKNVTKKPGIKYGYVKQL